MVNNTFVIKKQHQRDLDILPTVPHLSYMETKTSTGNTGFCFRVIPGDPSLVLTCLRKCGSLLAF